MDEIIQDEIYFILENIVDDIDEINPDTIQYISNEIFENYDGIVDEDIVRKIFENFKAVS